MRGFPAGIKAVVTDMVHDVDMCVWPKPHGRRQRPHHRRFMENRVRVAVQQITAFVACLTMDANRQKAGRMDWLCCFKGSPRYVELEEVSACSSYRQL